MARKIDEHTALLESQMVHGEYHGDNWRAIDRLEEEVERIKGAVAVMRWIVGESGAIDLEIPGYIAIDTDVPSKSAVK